MTKKRNGFIRFLLSFLPGAGEMYMGFMKMGVSLMSAFFLLIMVSMFLESGVLMFVDMIVWFYSFFHVHNLAGMSDEEFYAVEDEYLIPLDKINLKGKKLTEESRKIVSICLIILGIVLTYQGLDRMFYAYIPEWIYGIIAQVTNSLPKIVIGLAIIYIGVKMIHGKKAELDSLEDTEEEV